MGSFGNMSSHTEKENRMDFPLSAHAINLAQAAAWLAVAYFLIIVAPGVAFVLTNGAN